VPGLALLTERGPSLRRDLLAGVVLAALLVPQGMGYAQLAGLPPVTGLYRPDPLLVYFLLGPAASSSSAPTAPSARSSPPPSSRWPAPTPTSASRWPTTRAGRRGRHAGRRPGPVRVRPELLSMPVRVGYLAGIALTVIVSQLPKLFGYSIESENFIGAVREFVAGLDETDATALAFGAGCLVVILGLRLISQAARRADRRRRRHRPGRCARALRRVADRRSRPLRAPAGRLAGRAVLGRHVLLPAAIGIALAFADTSVLSRSTPPGCTIRSTRTGSSRWAPSTSPPASFQGFPSPQRSAPPSWRTWAPQPARRPRRATLGALLLAGTGLVHDMPLSALAPWSSSPCSACSTCAPPAACTVAAKRVRAHRGAGRRCRRSVLWGVGIAIG
jgi:hypothetical protein